jgi:hypothetical protein
MNLDNFTKQIDFIIIERGLELYEQDLYSEFSKLGNTYSMVAHGTNDYTVFATLDHVRNIKEYDCDCPYDYGPVCKHIVCLLFVIRENPLPENDAPGEENIPSPMETIVRALDKTTLEDYLLKQTYMDLDLYKTLIYRYSNDETKVKVAYSTVKEAIDWVDANYFEHDDYEDQWAESRRDIEKIYDEALGDDTKPDLSIRLLNAVLKACMESDSLDSEYAGFIMEDTLPVFKSLTERVRSVSKARKIAYEIMDGFYKKNTEDVLYRTNAKYLNIMARLHCEEHKEAFHELLTTLEMDETLKGLLKENIQLAMYEHLNSLYNPSVSKVYLHKHLESNPFLEIAYQRAMDEKDHAMAVKCAKTLMDKSRRTWLKEPYEWWLVNALLAQEDYEQAKPVLLSLVLGGDCEAFDTYESLYEKHAFEGEASRILSELKKRRVSDTLFTKIADKYQRHTELMSYTERYPSAISLAYLHIPDVYSDRVYQVFRTLVFDRAKTAHKRGAYRDIAKIVHLAKKAVGEKALQIETNLLSTYPRKTALKDEVLNYGH